MSTVAPSPFGPGNPERPSLAYLFLRFLRYGWLAWGGPVAQIGLMHRELVERDAWISEERFRKTLAVYQAIPGPEAHELAVYFGMIKRGRIGGLLTGLAFMLPGVLLVTGLAALYVTHGGIHPSLDGLLGGLRVAVVVLVAVAFVRLLRRVAPTPALLLIAAASAAAGLLWPGVNFLWILAIGGLVAYVLHRTRTRPAVLLAAGPLLMASFPAAHPSGLLALSAVMAKVGLLTFGGAYTAIPFLHEGAVQDHAWLTDAEFLDALALSGVVPGPLVAVGTFVGFLVGGPLGAALATVLIFAPAFAFTLLGHALLERLVHAPRLHQLLLGVTAAVIGLVGSTILPLAQAAFANPTSALVGAVAVSGFLLPRVPIPVVLMACGALGWLLARV